jgi:3-dehydroquinate synthase II
MGKQIWVKVMPWRADVAAAAIEAGADALWVEPGLAAQARQLGIISVISEDGDLRPGRDIVEKEILRKEDEEEIFRLSATHRVVVKGGAWKIIPLENLLSRAGNLFVEVQDLAAAQTALTILEKGVDGVLLNIGDPVAVRRILGELRRSAESFRLSTARIRRIAPLGLGDRVCVDTCSAMAPGEGLLVGNSSRALFLVHSESVENPFVNTRPFRVNAGPVHAYLRVADSRTKYLSEICAGDRALAVNFSGESYPVVVGRAKVERRPLALVEAEEGGERISVILQNAETIRLTQPDGRAISLVDLQEGTEVLVYREEEARHFGVRVNETILEK